MAHKKFDRDEAIALHDKGWTLTKLSEKYKVSVAAISEAFRNRGISSVKVKVIPPLDDMTLAYIAGLFDGEGHVSIMCSVKKGRSRYWLQTGITSTNKSFIEHIQGIFQCGHITQTGTKTEKKLDCWAWRCVANDALHFLELIEPFVICKKEVVQLGIEFQVHDKGFDSWKWCAGIKRQIGEINRVT